MNDDRRSSLLDFLLVLGAIWLFARWVRRVGVASAALTIVGAIVFDLGLAAAGLFLYSPRDYVAGLPVGLLLMLLGYFPLRKGNAIAKRRRQQAAAEAQAQADAQERWYIERQAQATAAAMRAEWEAMHRAAQPASGSSGQAQPGYAYGVPLAALDLPQPPPYRVAGASPSPRQPCREAGRHITGFRSRPDA